MISKKRLISWTKELLTVAVLVFILSNIISYIRKPQLSSNRLPELEVAFIDGSHYRLQQGKPLVVHFWAIWCPTCKLEAPNIESVSKVYDVVSVAVNSGNDTKIKDYMQERKLSFRVVNDSNGILAQTFQVKAYPTTFIYNAKGELCFTEVGYTTTAGLLARLKLCT